MKKYNLIFIKDGLLLSSKKYGSWREIQDEHENYKASVEFDSLKEVIEYIIMDYKLERVFAENLIGRFIENKYEIMPLDF